MGKIYETEKKYLYDIWQTGSIQSGDEMKRRFEIIEKDLNNLECAQVWLKHSFISCPSIEVNTNGYGIEKEIWKVILVYIINKYDYLVVSREYEYRMLEKFGFKSAGHAFGGILMKRTLLGKIKKFLQ